MQVVRLPKKTGDYHKFMQELGSVPIRVGRNCSFGLRCGSEDRAGKGGLAGRHGMNLVFSYCWEQQRFRRIRIPCLGPF